MDTDLYNRCVFIMDTVKWHGNSDETKWRHLSDHDSGRLQTLTANAWNCAGQ